MMASPADLQGRAIVITGPTASGKGAVAHELARATGGEIISMDSMKVYREMDVATAKPSGERRAEVRYHLVDVVDPDVDFSVGDYISLLEKALSEVRTRGRLAVIGGGTALYLKAYLDGFREGPPADWALRVHLLDEAQLEGPEALHRRLASLDPEAARRIHPRDLRRIVRALEVSQRTGKAISEGWRWGNERRHPEVRVFALAWTRKELYERIDRRVAGMVEKGLLEEARRLRDRLPPLSRSASQSIGYKEIWRGLMEGMGTEDLVARIQQSTRRFAKHQLTWFRRLPVEWIPVASPYEPTALAGEILRRLRCGPGSSRSSPHSP